MKNNSLSSRRKFRSAGDEIDYLYHKLLYWLYDRGDRRKALAFVDRLERLLEEVSPGAEAILSEECRSLIAEARGDLANAIRHRENEIHLIKRLHRISRNSASRDYVMRVYGYSDLSDCLDLLAVLYHDSGALDRAVNLLRASKRLCQTHGVAFDGEDLLDEYLNEKREASRDDGKESPGRKQLNRARGQAV
jgi:hypothetical protein